MDYLFKIRSAVSAASDAVSSVIPGNPVTREFVLSEQIASAGPALLWKVYSGHKKSTNKAASIWVMEKKDIERWPRREKEAMLELLKKGVSQLTRLRHPRMLVVEHPLEESRDSIAFCTEPVFASLANLLGQLDNVANPTPFAEFSLEDVEIRHGLFQLSEALTFLHNDARMLHRNLCPEAVVVNERGSWKLAGFDFSVTNQAAPGAPADFGGQEWTSEIMPVVQPVLDFMAPELILGGSSTTPTIQTQGIRAVPRQTRCVPSGSNTTSAGEMHGRVDTAADMFALGVLSFAVFSNGKTPTHNNNSISTFKKNATELKALPPSLLRGLPEAVRDDVKMCLNFTPDLRPDATQFSKISFFDTPQLKTLNYLDSLCQMDNAQKSQFFKGLPQILGRFPKRALIQKFYPYLVGEFGTAELIPFILPSVFAIAELASEEEFTAQLLPALTPVFRLQRPFQIALLLLQNMELLLSKTPEAEVKAHLLPLIYTALESDTAAIQELCLNIVPRISHLVDRESMKGQLLPKLLKLSTSAGVLSVKVNSLLCLGRLLEKLEKWMVTEQVLPALPRTNSKEPAVLMATLGIYKLAFESRSLGISKEQLAKSAIPFLVTVSIESSLNLSQFEGFMGLVKAMLAKVEEEQRSRLQQLSAMQEQQGSGVPDFAAVLNNSAHRQAIPKELHGLEAVAATQNGAKSTGKGPLSLEEKRRLAKEQEEAQRLRKQNPLVPESHGGGKPTQGKAFAMSVSKDPLGLTSPPKSSLPPFPGPPGQMGFGSPGIAPPPRGGTPMLTYGQTGVPGNFHMGTGNTGMGMSGGAGFGNFAGNPAFSQPQSSNMGSLTGMQSWGATPPRLGPPPMAPTGQSVTRPAVDLSAFDNLLSMGGSQKSAPMASQPKPKPAGAQGDLNDLLS